MPDTPSFIPEDRIGPYHITGTLGEGGFGIVYAAQRREPFVQNVAIKVLKAGMDSNAILARFEQERQALAVMDHPGIARVLDGGLTDATSTLGPNRPYFVMELVSGKPITHYCAENTLSLADRLALFMQVCDAVQHAHMKGVIHRDLKPSNILVTVIDGKPQPKIIDFGIAKAMTGGLTDRTLFTDRGSFLGTPEYMSPEQAGGGGGNGGGGKLDIDTRTDVYALGVVLYELLTGELPFTSEELRRAGFAEVLRIIREVEPPKPSTRVSRLARTTASEPRTASQPPTIIRGGQLRGDLDWIVMRSIEKSRARRYESPSALAADVGRFLRTEPVEAGPPSASYKLAKFVRRRKGLVFAATLALAAILIGLVLALHGRSVARAQRDLAVAAEQSERTAKQAALDARDAERIERIRAQAAADFIASAVHRSNPFVEETDLSLSKLLNLMSAELDRGTEMDEQSASAVRGIIGGTYRALGRPKKAVEELEKTRDQFIKDGDQNSSRFTENAARLATAQADLRQYDAALQTVEAALPRIIHSAFSDDRRLAAKLHVVRAVALSAEDNLADAEKSLAEALAIRTAEYGADSVETADVLDAHAVLLTEVPERQDDALKLAEQALAIREKHAGKSSPLVEKSLHNIGRIHRERGDLASSVEFYTRALAINASYAERSGLRIAQTQNALAVTLRDLDRLDDAEQWARKAVDTYRANLGPSVPLADALDVLAGIAFDRANYPDAIAAYREEIGMLDSPPLDKPAESPLSRALTGLAGALAKINEFVECEKAARRAVEIRGRIMHPGDWRIFSSQSLLGLALAEQNKLAEAESLLAEAAEAIWLNPAIPPRRKRPVLERAIRLYTLSNNEAERAKWQARLDDLAPQRPG